MSTGNGPITTIEVVLFKASFRVAGVRGGPESPNISHALRPDRSATLCGRKGWVTEEGPQPLDTICCLRCMKKLPKATQDGDVAPSPSVGACPVCGETNKHVCGVTP